MTTRHQEYHRYSGKPRVFLRVLYASLLWMGLPLSAGAATRLEGSASLMTPVEGRWRRVAVTDVHGKFVEIAGRHAHAEYLGKRWCYVDGSFALTIPEDGASIEIRRGLETLPLSARIAGGGSKKVAKTFRLRRWIDMSSRGYVNGDIHAHLPVPKVAHPQMRGEDLNTLTLLYLPDEESPIATNRCFTGKLDACSTPGCEIYVGQELQEWQMGHVAALLGLKSLVPGYPHAGGSLEHWKGFPQWDLMRALRATRRQNGTILWSHISSLPGTELPVALALGLVDGVELITWSDPTQFPNHWGPWEDSGFSQAEFPVMRSMDLYYQFLNAGFRLPIAAGTDKMGEEIPLGSNRTYARVTGARNYDSWLAAVKAGRGFVTNGPIVEFEVAGSEPGDVVEFQGGKTVKARATVRSILPINTVDIVMNGRKVGHKTIPLLRQDPPADGLYSLEVEATVELTDSAWLAARVIDHPDLPNRVLPRGLSVFAHTSPIYFLKDGRKVREPASIAYLQKYVEGTLHWLGTNPNFALEEDRQAAQNAADQALQFYKDL